MQRWPSGSLCPSTRPRASYIYCYIIVGVKWFSTTVDVGSRDHVSYFGFGRLQPKSVHHSEQFHRGYSAVSIDVKQVERFPEIYEQKRSYSLAQLYKYIISKYARFGGDRGFSTSEPRIWNSLPTTSLRGTTSWARGVSSEGSGRTFLFRLRDCRAQLLMLRVLY